jgi:hypothetical protein
MGWRHITDTVFLRDVNQGIECVWDYVRLRHNIGDWFNGLLLQDSMLP